LASDSGVSTRHLSFVETGRARPSRELILHLAEHLDVPLRERNRMLLAAGFAPAYSEEPLDAPEMAAVLASLELVLRAGTSRSRRW
jgi:transcriptional regulator with XRE-family HTH domain